MRGFRSIGLSLVLALAVAGSACEDKGESGAPAAESDEATSDIPEVEACKAIHAAQQEYKAKHASFSPDIKLLQGKKSIFHKGRPSEKLLSDDKKFFAAGINAPKVSADTPITDYLVVVPGKNGIFGMGLDGVVKKLADQGSIDMRDYEAVKKKIAAAPAAE